MMSAAFSPTMIVGAFVLPFGTDGKIDESTILKLSIPLTLHFVSTTAMVGEKAAGPFPE